MGQDESIRCQGRSLESGGGPIIFGVLNVTPDSFSDGGRFDAPARAIAAGCRMAREGADVIDVGGESTRPGTDPVVPDEQIRRTREVIAGLAEQFGVEGRFGPEGPAISIDTRSAPVARAALDAGAVIINDVSALRDDPAMARLAAETGAVVVLMHMKGSPETMQRNPTYEDVVDEIKHFLAERIEYATTAGISRRRIVIDPGIGFGKTTDHNLEILRRVGEFRSLGVPVLVGPSRKRFIGEVLGIAEPTDRLMGTAGAVAGCVLAGVECVRVHDVAAGRQVADLCAAIRAGGTR